MKRRRILTLIGPSLLAGVAGCPTVTSRFSDGPKTPEGMTVETQNWTGGFVHSEGREKPYAIVVTSADEATDKLGRHRSNRVEEDPITFIEQTEFADSYLIMVSWCCAPSDASLECSQIERRESGVHVEAEVNEPDGVGPGDMTTHTLFIRVTDNQEDTPERATIEVDAQST